MLDGGGGESSYFVHVVFIPFLSYFLSLSLPCFPSFSGDGGGGASPPNKYTMNVKLQFDEITHVFHDTSRRMMQMRFPMKTMMPSAMGTHASIADVVDIPGSIVDSCRRLGSIVSPPLQSSKSSGLSHIVLRAFHKSCHQ